MGAVIPPSGQQVRIRAGDTEAVLVEVGGALRQFRVGGRDVIDGYDETAQASGGRGQVLVPWPNRLRDGAWNWQGTDLQLPLSEPSLHNASHGLVRWQTWSVDAVSAAAAEFSCVVAPQPGYPFRLRVATRYSVEPGSLTVTVTAGNLSSVDAPVGMGMHPYLTVGTEFVDTASLSLGAGIELVTDERSLPVGDQPSSGWAGPIGAAVIDTTFGELARDADGLARVTLAAHDRSATLWLDATWKWAQVFTGDTLPAGRRRRGVAIEPLTCPPDALRSGRDVVTLAPGETLSGSWGITAG